MTLIKDLLAEFNVKVQTGFDLEYKNFEPQFNDLAYRFNSGNVATTNFVFSEFLSAIEEFTGTVNFKTFPEGHKFTITNKEWVDGRTIARRNFMRAKGLGDLDLYAKNVIGLAQSAKDHPYELIFDMIEAGDANTYGTTFDGQNMFDTTHSYDVTAGTQSNLITGAGTGLTDIEGDMRKAVSAIAGYYYQQSQGTGNAKKRKLNKTMNNLLVIAPNELHGIFWQLQTADLISNNTNIFKNKFKFVTMPFTDTNDWYLINLDGDGIMKPFLLQIEEEPQLRVPNESDHSVKNNLEYQWMVNYSGNVGYGAWWKAIMVTNT